MPSKSGQISDCDDVEDIVRVSITEKRHVNRILDSDSDEECNTAEILLSENQSASVTEDVTSSEIVSANKSVEEGVTGGKLEFHSSDTEEDRLGVNDCSSSEKSEIHFAKKKKGAPRKSKLNALEEIRSESQRIIRESRVSLPYHRPKQRSLADFLNRRKSLTVVPLKAAKEKLTEVWQQIEQREKMAEKFFDSDTDDSDTDLKEMCTEKKEKTESNSTFSIEIIKSDSTENNSSSQKIENGHISSDKINENTTEELNTCNILYSKNIKENSVVYDFDNQKVNDPSGKLTSDYTHSLSDIVTCDGTSIHSSAENYTKTEDSIQSVTEEDKFQKGLSSIDIFAESQEAVIDSSELELSAQNNKTSPADMRKHKLNLISEETLNTIPKISGSSDEIINLDDNVTTTKGTVSLMKRFMKHVSLQPGKVSKEEQISIVASEVNEKGEIINLSEETVNVHNEETKLPKLGQKLGLLKATLQQKISQSREQQLAKRVQEYRLYEDELEPEDKLETDDPELGEEEELDLTETETESEPEEDDVVDNIKEKKLKNPFVEEEAEVSEDDGTTEGELSEDENIGESEKILKPHNQEELNGVNIPKTQNDEDAMNNLLDLCSGNFTSQPINLNDLEECETEQTKVLEDIDNEASDFEEEVDDEVLPGNDSDEELIIAKRKKKKKKVYISDDDDEEENHEQNEMKQSVEDIDDPEGIGENSDADEVSDTNQLGEDEQDDLQSIAEDMTSDHEGNLVEDEEDELAKKISKEFLDGEAELSGSDWDSADEDERELDDLEAELGDEDKISERKLQKELGKIHLKEIMAEDKREVRLLQELLLEDGELHSDGPKRQRVFRWYNDDNENLGPDRYVEGEEGEPHLLAEEDDETWRRTRTEREKFLREKNIDNLEDLRNSLDSSALNIGKSIRSTPKISPNILKSPDPKLQFKLVNKRGSFLNRSEKILNKLAQISTNTGLSENPIGSSKGKKNMVFAVVSPPKSEEKIEILEENKKILKRKSDFVITPPVKKIRFSSDTNVSSKRFSLLEQLKQSDMT